MSLGTRETSVDRAAFPSCEHYPSKSLQKNASIFSSDDGAASFHVGLLLAMVPGTATSQPENFIVLHAM